MRKEVHRTSILVDVLKALILELERSLQSGNRLAIQYSLKKCEVLEETIVTITRKR